MPLVLVLRLCAKDAVLSIRHNGFMWKSAVGIYLGIRGRDVDPGPPVSGKQQAWLEGFEIDPDVQAVPIPAPMVLMPSHTLTQLQNS